MAWRCVYNIITGNALSFGTDIESPVPDGYAAAIVADPTTNSIEWDPVTRAMIPRPPKILVDKVETIMTAVAAAGITLNPTNQTRLRNILQQHITEGRFSTGS